MNQQFERVNDFPAFVTITCLWWKPLLLEKEVKEIIIQSLYFLTRNNRIRVYAFVIMSNHMHLVWQMLGNHRRQDVQRDFLKFTSHQILTFLRAKRSPIVKSLFVGAKDRKYQVWERNSLGIPLWSGRMVWQKVDYIHNNPVKAGLSKCPEDYEYSSASFYYFPDNRWNFLTRIYG